ncbi:hypothetical protein [Gracilibacillus phocaeensis]|uniref:hypothetical protein n=1 Tax=Gracilibacillus phocaeensis TaxID=2042304 RepID=UPI001030367E|nr:hypothetical protein [Gracilibacillus phocaeensis]
MIVYAFISSSVKFEEEKKDEEDILIDIADYVREKYETQAINVNHTDLVLYFDLVESVDKNALQKEILSNGTRCSGRLLVKDYSCLYRPFLS